MKYTWIKINLFCIADGWRALMSEGIQPLVTSLDSERFLSFNLTVDYDGSCVTLALLTNKEKQHHLMQELRDHFERFFSEMQEVDARNSRMVNLPEGRVELDLDVLEYDEPETGSIYRQREYISTLILNFFKRNPAEVDAIFMFGFSLHILAFDAIYLNNLIATEDLCSIYFPFNYLSNPHIALKYDEREMEQKIQLLTTSTHHLFKETRSDQSSWMSEWKGWIENYFDRIHVAEKLAEGESVSDKLRQLLSAVNEQLNVNNDFLEFLVGKELVQIYPLFQKELARLEKALRNTHHANVRSTGRILKNLNNLEIPSCSDEIRLFVICRNEHLRLPYFLNYYLKLGVDRIVIIDNNSTDATVDIALSYPNVHVFSTTDGFRNYWNWMEYILPKYGMNNWCVVADVDELLTFPFVEELTLRQLVAYFEYSKQTALRCLLLDMYAATGLKDIHYRAGENPLDYCGYFDEQYNTGNHVFFDYKNWEYFKMPIHAGGVRSRVFYDLQGGRHHFCLTKIPFFKPDEKTYLAMGMHAINHATIADIQGTVLHTKFLQDFGERSIEESQREEHWNNALEYKYYQKKIHRENNLCLLNADSIKFRDSSQLVELGFMHTSESFNRFCNTYKQKISHF